MKSLTNILKKGARNAAIFGAVALGLIFGAGKTEAQEQLRVFSSKHVTAINPQGIVTGGYEAETANYEDEASRLKSTNGTWYGDQVVNPFIRPGYRDKDMGEREYYGSKDVNGNHVINESADVQEIYNGNTSYRGDVNADGVTNSTDAGIIQSVINLEIPYAPSDWNYLTKQEKIDYFEKLVKLDDTDTYHEGWTCGYYMNEFVARFAGLEKAKDYPFYNDFSQLLNMTTENGLFNLPVYRVSTKAKDGNNHFIVGILVGDNPTNFYDWCFLEEQIDQTVKPGDFSMRSEEGDIIQIDRLCYYYNDFDKEYNYTIMPNVAFALHNKDPPTLYKKHPDLVTSRPGNPVSGIENRLFDKEDIIGNVYPNPYTAGNGEITIPYYGNGLEANVLVTDVLGRTVYNNKYQSTATTNEEIKISPEYTSSLSAGNYNVIVSNKKGKETSILTVVK